MNALLRKMGIWRSDRNLSWAFNQAGKGTQGADLVKALYISFYARERKARSLSGKYTVPFYSPAFLQEVADCQALAQTQKTLAQLSIQTLDDSHQVMFVGLLDRLGIASDCQEEITALLHNISGKSLSLEALIEALVLLHARQSWQTLHRLAKEAIELLPPNFEEYAIALDLCLLAELRLLIRDWRHGDQESERLDLACSRLEWVADHAHSHPKNQLLLKAMIASVRGDYASSINRLAEARHVKGLMFKIFSHNIDHYVPLDWEPPLPCAPSGKTTDYYRHQANGQACLLVSSDQKYFEKYADSFLGSFAHWNVNNLVHWHFVNFNPSPHVISELETKHNIKINYTVEHQPLLRKDPELIRGYYACARYMHLPAYLEHYGKIFISDVDGFICQSIDSEFPDTQDSVSLHSGVLHKPHAFPGFIWDAIRAGAFAITDGPVAKKFARFTADYLVWRFDQCCKTGQRYFYADQVALILAYCRFQKSLKFHSLDGVYTQHRVNFRAPKNSRHLFPQYGNQPQ